MLKDRKEAGRKLAARLRRFKSESPVVLALPRGGVVVGYEVARALAAPLDIVVVRKLGAPGQPELAVGALADGDPPEEVLNEDAIAMLGVSREYLDGEIARQLAEIRRREACYRGNRPPQSVRDHTAIVVDDGIATGASMRAALRGVRRAEPGRLVLAVPVAPRDTIESLRAEVDDVVCLSTPAVFLSVGLHYRDFSQTDDEEVIALLSRARVGALAIGGTIS